MPEIVEYPLAPRATVLLTESTVDRVARERWYTTAGRRPFRVVGHTTQALATFLLELPPRPSLGARVRQLGSDPRDFTLANLRFVAGTIERRRVSREHPFHVRVGYLGRRFSVGAPSREWGEDLLARAAEYVLVAYARGWSAERLWRELYREFKVERRRKWRAAH